MDMQLRNPIPRRNRLPILRQMATTRHTHMMATHSLTDQARMAAADKGMAMQDGSYPVRDRQELAKAILALGRAKDKAMTRRHIIMRARALNALDLLPASWNVT